MYNFKKAVIGEWLVSFGKEFYKTVYTILYCWAYNI